MIFVERSGIAYKLIDLNGNNAVVTELSNR